MKCQEVQEVKRRYGIRRLKSKCTKSEGDDSVDSVSLVMCNRQRGVCVVIQSHACIVYGDWVHKRGSGVTSSLSNEIDFYF